MISQFISWIKSHKGIAATTLFVAFLAGGLATAFIVQMREVGNKGWEMLSGAQFLASQGQFQDSHKVYNELETRYAKSKTGDYGLLLHATLFAQEGNWTAALERYQSVISRNRVKPLVPIAVLGLARTYEASGKYIEAAEGYDKFISGYPNHFGHPMAYQGLARINEFKGDMAKAKENLERLRVLYPDSVWSRHAEMRLRLMPPGS